METGSDHLPAVRTPRSVWVMALCGVVVWTSGSCKDKSKVTANPSAKIVQEAKVVSLSKPSGSIFDSQVADSFYPADPARLRSMIEGYLAHAGNSLKELDGHPLGIVVPHAGYPYSGPIAAFAFASVARTPFRRVVVLGAAHRRGYPTPAVLDASAYRTPLGDIPIDRDGVTRLARTKVVMVDSSKFKGEHALEVELPFLQVALKDFLLVPIMISDPQPEAMLALAKVLGETFPGGDTLYVASTDLSHDYPYDVAVVMDGNAGRLVTALDVPGLIRAYREHLQAGMDVEKGKDGKLRPDCAQLCGLGPVLTLIELAKTRSQAKATVLDLRNSGDIVGDKGSRIVGYMAAVFTVAKGPVVETEMAKPDAAREPLGEADQKELLTLARRSLEVFLRQGKNVTNAPQSARLRLPGAAFVTLKNKEDLRGCIGYLEPTDPLWKMIRDRAVDAAVNDPRFSPVTNDELPGLTIEISVLSPRLDVQNPLKEIVIGRDGVWLELGTHRGVFLPQVPQEQNWKTVEEYLGHLCQKAHLVNKDCWKDPSARIQRFTAQVFSEPHRK